MTPTIPSRAFGLSPALGRTGRLSPRSRGMVTKTMVSLRVKVAAMERKGKR
ncbi:hypothetical protein EMPG_16252 [Blastomyces silverae]|uniref:Uncharacterized protein n=1 Tax=Blastomyces silverae TaxID=2060906 RepID=A0A0H1BA67_9EURO|nr:hypothetical protein EMPG_16252 [Blastomyces silverae]